MEYEDRTNERQRTTAAELAGAAALRDSEMATNPLGAAVAANFMLRQEVASNE